MKIESSSWRRYFFPPKQIKGGVPSDVQFWLRKSERVVPAFPGEVQERSRIPRASTPEINHWLPGTMEKVAFLTECVKKLALVSHQQAATKAALVTQYLRQKKEAPTAVTFAPPPRLKEFTQAVTERKWDKIKEIFLDVKSQNKAEYYFHAVYVSFLAMNEPSQSVRGEVVEFLSNMMKDYPNSKSQIQGLIGEINRTFLRRGGLGLISPEEIGLVFPVKLPW